MIDSLSHRGPDAKGAWFSEDGMGLGHARLIVVDPCGGRQPMTRSVGQRSWTISYNGELYNAPELRDRLRARGYGIETSSDTEVVLLAYAEWGADCLTLLNGIFAFAIYDSVDRKLFLCRDRLGVKPLFYARTKHCFMFASEIKALLAHPDLEARLPARGLAEVVANFPVRTPGHAVFEGIEEVRPGWYVESTLESTKARQYWRLNVEPHGHDEKQTIDHVRQLLGEAVRRQLVADVPICALLSGGVDSSAIAALAAGVLGEAGGAPLTTFSVAFAESSRHFKASEFHPDEDEPFARLVAEELQTRHRSLTLSTTEVLDAYASALAARDLPGLGDFDAALLLLCRFLKPHATVALSGEGADEIFGGYPWAERMGQTGFYPWALLGSVHAWILRPDVAEIVKPEEYARQLRETVSSEVVALGGSAGDRDAVEPAYVLLTRFLPSLLERKDRMSMAAGVEVRVPFCDHRLVEYVWNLPIGLKQLGGVRKGLLRSAVEDLLPVAVQRRAKCAFPTNYDPLFAARLRIALERKLDEPEAPLFQIFRRAAVQQLVAQRPGTVNYQFTLLLSFLLQFDAWAKHYRVRFA